MVSRPGNFETHFFREENKAAFLQAWARAKYNRTYENLIILLNGIPDGHLADEEWVAYEALEQEMEPLFAKIDTEHREAERLKKEAAADLALATARIIASMERERDLQQLQVLQRKLGIK